MRQLLILTVDPVIRRARRSATGWRPAGRSHVRSALLCKVSLDCGQRRVT